MDIILQEVASICRDVFNDANLVINSQSSANDIDAWDSMTNLFLIDQIEKKYGIKFSLDEILEAQNVGDLCTIIDKRKKI